MASNLNIEVRIMTNDVTELADALDVLHTGHFEPYSGMGWTARRFYSDPRDAERALGEFYRRRSARAQETTS